MQGYFEDIVKLRAVTAEIKDGFATRVPATEKTVYAEKKSVGRTEFYLSAQAGMRADIVFALRAADYSQELEVEHGGLMYSVVRTYQKDRDLVELVCVRRD